MNSKRKLKLYLKKVPNNEEREGILFSNIAYIVIFVDDVNLFTLDLYQGSFLYFKELKKSITKSDKYLLFTSVSGIADDAGWNYIDVKHEDDSIVWYINRENNFQTYIFEKIEYLREISKIEDEIANLDINIKLEPLCVIYPE